jgi:pimeloyl-ACP methyl ester carboxylesterase
MSISWWPISRWLLYLLLLHINSFALQELCYKYTNKFGVHDIRYTASKPVSKSNKMPPIVFIHGFGGNADQFRYQMQYFGDKGFNSYAIDLLGYGYSSKPNPRNYEVNEIYNFQTWADQTIEFINDVVREPCILVCNSVGGLVGLQTANNKPNLISGLVLIDISHRQLHVTKQNIFQRQIVPLIQTTLRETSLGKYFFTQVAQREVLKNILKQAYAAKSLDDEIVDIILKPGLEPGAAEVFLDFISYSSGPLVEELLPKTTCPVRILWGELDPWESVEEGRNYAQFPCVDKFVVIKDAGHCPMDQKPTEVNSLISEFITERFVGKKVRM